MGIKLGERSAAQNCAGKSRTKQADARMCNINTIMARYRKTGILGSPDALQRRQAVFADVSDIPDFRETCDRIAAAERAFERLPADVRFKFRNDPRQLVEFIQNEGNREEAEKIGLIEKRTEKPVDSLDNTGVTDTTASKVVAE